MLVAAVVGIFTNYATVDPPVWLADPVRNWLILALLVAVAMVLALVMARAPVAPEPLAAVAPRFGTGTGSLLTPVPESTLRGRDDELRRLRELTARPADRFVVVAGAGGMGKTSLAQAAAAAARAEGRKVFWVRWRSLDQLAGHLQEAAAELGLSAARIGAAQQSGASLADPVWEHLARTRGWVIVLDNLDQPAAACIEGDLLREYRGWVRPGGAGLLIVTSRDRDPRTWGAQGELLVLDPLDPGAGAAVLLDLAPRAGDRVAAEQLAGRLGGLPLALHAAGAAVAAPTSRYPTFTTYAAALADRTARLLSDQPDVADHDMARRLVGYTWELSLDQLTSEGHPSARPLLRLLALFAEAPVPRTAIVPELFTGQVRADSGLIEAPNTTVLDAALAGLHRYGLIDTPDPQTSNGVPTVALHPVVRDGTRDLLTAAVDKAAWQHAVDTVLVSLLAQIEQAGPAGWDTASLLAPHVLLLADLGGSSRDPGGSDTAVSRATSAYFRFRAIDEFTTDTDVTWTHDFSGVRNNNTLIVFATSDPVIARLIPRERVYPLFELWMIDEDHLDQFAPNLRDNARIGISYTDTDGFDRTVDPKPLRGEEVTLQEHGQYVRLPEHLDRNNVRIIHFDLYDLVHSDHVVKSIETLSFTVFVRNSSALGFVTWSPPHPCFVHQITFDVQDLPFEGQRLAYLVLVSPLTSDGLPNHPIVWEEVPDRIEVNLEAWMLPGHTVTLLWRPLAPTKP